MGGLFHELRRRNVVRVAGAYAVVGWLLVQVATTLEESMSLPAWFDGLIVALLLIGLPVVLIFSWAFELTPDGVVRTEEVPEDQSITRKTGRKLDYVIIAGLAILIGMLAWQGYRGPGTDDSSVAAESPPAAESADGEGTPFLRKSIAVLPFANRSPNPEDAFFTEGVHDDLLTHLSKIGDLHVISRTSVIGYTDTERKIPEIARELGVATVMEGAVQRAGKRVRINVQLIDAATDAHLWAEIYDRELTAENVFDIQSEITKAIAKALNAVLSTDEQSELDRLPTHSVAAYDAYMAGRLNSGTVFLGEEQFRKAIVSFDRAIEMDPDFAAAYAGKAFALLGAHWYSSLSGNWREQALTALEKAEQLAPDAVEVLNARGYYQYWGHLDYKNADVAYSRALAQAPNYIDAIAGKAFAARRDGRFEEGFALLERASRLDPRNDNISVEVAATGAMLGRFTQASQIAHKLTTRRTLSPFLINNTAQIFVLMGDLDSAWKVAAQGIGDPDPVNQSVVSFIVAQTRDTDAIRNALANWPENARRPDDAPELYELANARAKLALGDRDEAQRILRAVKQRIDAESDPYPQGWKPNALYFPVTLPGLMGDLEGVRAAAADYEANTKPDAWVEQNIFTEFAEAFVRAGDSDGAFDYIGRGVSRYGLAFYPQLSIRVALDPIREDPRYLALKSDYEAWVEHNLR